MKNAIELAAFGNHLARIEKDNTMLISHVSLFAALFACWQGQNQPDSTLFELAVLVLYLKNGWSVVCLEEARSGKTPDFEAKKNGQTFWVECKRLAKVPEFADQERAEWQKRFRHLTNAMRLLNISAHAEVVFNVPIADTSEFILSQLFTTYHRQGALATGEWLTNGPIDFRATILDIPAINETLDHENPRQNSPGMIKAITGNYEMNGAYTQLIAYKQFSIVGPDDGLHVLNKFVNSIYSAYSAKYKCVAPASIEKKAKDVRKSLSKAVSQIPAEGVGIIHIGYETVSGPEVEVVRQKRTKEMIDEFKFDGKNIQAIYCHAIQPLVTVGEFECAETTLYFEKGPERIFTETLLLDPPGTEKRNNTHWEEDLNA